MCWLGRLILSVQTSLTIQASCDSDGIISLAISYSVQSLPQYYNELDALSHNESVKLVSQSLHGCKASRWTSLDKGMYQLRIGATSG